MIEDPIDNIDERVVGLFLLLAILWLVLTSPYWILRGARARWRRWRGR